MMLRAINLLSNRFGLEVRRQRGIAEHRFDSVVTLPPKASAKGRVLISYIIDPFLQNDAGAVSNTHTHFWESLRIATTFQELGYFVDVISHRNRTFKATAEYDLFLSARTNLEVIADSLTKGCLKIAHLDTAHWLFNNQAASTRLIDLQRRRGITLGNRRTIEENWAIENAQIGTVLGNQFTMETYAYAGKPLHRVPISVPAAYSWPTEKNFDHSRKNFIWFGSEGFVHKGLDLVLEAFAQLPDYQLTVFGPLHLEERFVEAFRQELYETPNIRAYGWIDVESDEFQSIAADSLAVVYPSCSEGGGGSVITCMHAGLIPVVTYETSVDVKDGGVVLPVATVDAIKDAVVALADKPADELQAMARSAWDLARQQHTRERFARDFMEFARQALDVS